MPSYTSIKDGASFQGRDSELVEMSEKINKVKVGDRTVAVASYWYNRAWLAKNLFPERASEIGNDEAALNQLADEEGLPERCPGSLWAINQVKRERRDIFIDSGLSFSSKTVDQIKDLGDLDADSRPGAYQVPYLNGPTGSGKTMLVRIYAAATGKAYFPVLCTGDDELMLTKKLKGKKDLRASVRTEEMKKRAEFGVFETKDALLSFLRSLKKNGAGSTPESHMEAFRKISQTDWDFTAESNGFPSDNSFSGIYVYGEAELAARIPMGVVVNFDEFGLASGAVQADIRELFFDRSSDLTPGVNTTFTTTDNPAGEKYFNRTPIAGDNASRLQFRTIALPSPDEMVPDIARGFGHTVEVEEANRRLLGDEFCNTTPGLEEARPSILQDTSSMDRNVIPPKKLFGKDNTPEGVSTFFKNMLGDEYDQCFQQGGESKILSKFLSKEQAVNLSMRLSSLFCRVYKHVNDPTGPLNPKFYNHDSANAPEFSRRTLRSICSGIENKMRDLLENIKDGASSDIPEQLALCVQTSLNTYIFKQLDFRAAPTGTTLEGDSGRRAARESRPVISQLLQDSGLGWTNLKDLFAPAQGGWAENDASKLFQVGESKVATHGQLSEACRNLAGELKPQDSIVRFKFGNEAIYVPIGGEQALGGKPTLDAKQLYKHLDPNNDGITPEGVLSDFDVYRKTKAANPNDVSQDIFDAALAVETSSGRADLQGLADRLAGSASGTRVSLDFGAKWGGDVEKTTGGGGVYILALGQGKALAFDFDPVAAKTGKTEGVFLSNAGDVVKFLSDAVVKGDAPAFSVQASGRAHKSVQFVASTGAPLYVSQTDGELRVERKIPAMTMAEEPSVDGPGSQSQGAPSLSSPPKSGPVPSATSQKRRPKQTYRKPGNVI